MSIWDWSKTPASNTTLEANSWAEGMSPAGVNNGVRAIAAALKEYQEDTGGAITSSGTNTITITTNGGITAYADGMEIAFVAGGTNTGASTANVDVVGAKAVRKVTADSTNDIALEANDIRQNGHYTIRYDASANSAAGAWILLNPSNYPDASDTAKGIVELATAAELATATDTGRVVTPSHFGAWTAYTPTITAQTGTFTTVSAVGRYRQIGKTVIVSIDITITANGTAAGDVRFTLPVTADTAVMHHGAGRERAIGGFTVLGFVISSTTGIIVKYENSYPGATGAVIGVTMIYQAA